MNRADATIIGTGALGSALVRALHASGYPLKSIYNRTVTEAEALAGQVGAERHGTFPEKREDLGKIVILTVPDRRIKTCAHDLSGLAGREGFGEFLFVHCSGLQPASALSELAARGASVAAFHPLQTFTSESVPADFRDIFFDIEGEKPALSRLQDLAEALGARTLTVDASEKPYLHAAAVTASNYLLALIEVSGRIAALGGMDEAEVREALLPLLQKTVSNAGSGTLTEVLSGPVKRGDVQTVREHIELLQSDELLLSLYKKLGLIALSLAKESSGLDRQKAAELDRLLN